MTFIMQCSQRDQGSQMLALVLFALSLLRLRLAQDERLVWGFCFPVLPGYFWLDCDGKSNRRALVGARHTMEKNGVTQ